MICNFLFAWALLLLSIGPLLAHPISESSDMSYPAADSAEEAGAVSPEELYLSSLLQNTPGLGYTPLLSRDEGLKVSGLVPKDMLKEVLLDKPSYLNSLSQLLGIKRPYRKRGIDCFWKYCI